MEKVSLVAILFAVVLFAGCGEKVQKLKDTKDKATSKIEENKSLVGGLKDAMKNGVAMKCETTDEDGTWVVYTNGKNIRSMGREDGQIQNMLKKGDITYTWTEGKKTGQMMDVNCLKDFKKELNMPGLEDSFEEEDFSFEELEEGEESGKTKCSPSTEGDFSVPKGIDFTDQCAVIKKQMEGFKGQMEQMQKAQQK